MKTLNGHMIPDNLSIPELREMLCTRDMLPFSLACNALKNKDSHEAYLVLKEFLDSEDKYQQRCVLSVIFHYQESAELCPYFLSALRSKERFMVTTVLDHLIVKNLWVSDDDILTCFESNYRWLGNYYYQILRKLEKIPENTERVVGLLKKAKASSTYIATAECLTFLATPENYMQLFTLFADSPVSKVRLEACKIANAFQRYDLLQRYVNDTDGHVRKYVTLSLQSRHT